MKEQTSWESSSNWYNRIVGEKGHFYHEMIIPNVLRLLNVKKGSSVLDLACGQGVLARALSKECTYHGIDLSSSLIASAKKMSKGNHCQFTVADICKPLPLNNAQFSHATLILAAQNIENPLLAFKEAFRHLTPNGSFLIVLNHPCFRIPRQSHWGIEEAKKLQYRRMDCYMSSLKIPIQTNPGMGKNSETTLTFHHPLSTFTRWLTEANFMIQVIEEWTSDKESTGKNAKMENRARNEFPLFITLLAKKNGD